MRIDYHLHLLARMAQRGITRQEVERTLAEGRAVSDARPGSQGKVLVHRYDGEGLGRFYEEKEVTVYHRMSGEELVVLTAIARYGSGLERRER